MTKMAHFSLFFLTLFFNPSAWTEVEPSLTPKNLENKVPQSLILLGDDQYFPNSILLVDKSQRTLSSWAFSDQRWILKGTYPSDSGKEAGNKIARGDLKTPEGIYRLISVKEKEQLDFKRYGVKAFVTNYPNLFDKRQGKTGHGIWLHAIPDETPLTRGSEGCVVVRNNIIEELAKDIVINKTSIIIQKKVEYITEQQWDEKKNSLLKWFNNWKLSWKTKDLKNYMNFYSKDLFRSQAKNWQGWKKYKRRLFSKHSEIKVQTSLPVILQNDQQMTLQFLQKYTSTQHNDFGEKTLYAQKENGEWKIIAESWKRASLKSDSLLVD